jgi:Fe-S cluster assembly protein SufD
MSATSPAITAWDEAFAARPESSALQRQAFADFLTRGLPTQKNDAWKYTDLRRLAMRRFALAQTAPSAFGNLLLSPSASYGLVFVDGMLLPASIPQANGVTVDSGVAVATTKPAGGAEQTAFALLNTALLTGQAHIAVADGCILDRPIYVAYLWTPGTANLMAHPRLRLSLGRNSKTTLVEHHLGANGDANFSNSVVEIDIGEAAALQHVRINEDAASNFNIHQLSAAVARSATYLHYQYVLGGALSRADLEVDLSGAGANVELHGLVFARGTQHLDVRSCIRHSVPDTRSREDYRGIADHRGRVVFNGKVVVAQHAQRTDAGQSSRNLLLSPQAEIDTRPELEIYANDVKCAHGATVGQLDAAALFYLQSRGLDLPSARALLTHAFAAELIERIPLPAVREHVLAALLKRLHAEENQ